MMPLSWDTSIQTSRIARHFVVVALLCLAFSSGVQAQKFQTVSSLSFTVPVGDTNALTQIVTVASNSTAFNFYETASTSSGGNWLSAVHCSNGNYPCATPTAVDVHATASGLAAGTYQGKIVFTDTNNPSITTTVPVTLTVLASSSAFFDNLPGALSFSFTPSGASTAQSFQIRNAGSGSLSWTLSATTADGGSWLGTSATSGTAPSSVSVTITPANLPGGGSVAGTFAGQLTLHTSGDSTTIPISVTVGTSVFRQINPISFTMPLGGANPLPQVLSVDTADNSATNYYQVGVAANGGNWLSVPGCSNGNYPCVTPHPFAVAIQNASTLAAGTYMGEVTIYQDTNPSMSVNVPVTLNVVAGGPFFNNLGGGLSFSMVKGGATISPQTIGIQNAGTGTLNWTVAASTADGGAWLSTNTASGTAPSQVTVSITPSALPGGGAIAGVFVGQLVFESGTDIATIPVAVTVAANILNQVNPISFTMPLGGTNPVPQVLTIANTDGNPALNFYTVTNTASGGNWLSVPACSNGNYPCNTPFPVTVNVVNASTLAAGTYTGEVTVYQDTNPQLSLTIPVTLNVVPSGALLNSLGGGLSFSLEPNGTAVPQTIEIENAGSGTLSWTVTPETSDGGAWLSTTPTTGNAPSEVKVIITTANLPGAGALAGTFTGQLLFHTGTDTTTIPVSVTVGANVFTQVNPISFTMAAGGANPLPQILTVNNTVFNSPIAFYSVAATSGGNWLSVPACSNSNYPCSTPFPVTVNVVNANTLAAGTYTGEVTFYQDTNPAMSVSVPVTLNVEASGAFFNNLPGQLSFTMPQNALKVTAQALQIGNAGSGTLKFTITPSTADGGAWLTTSAVSGSAPKSVNIGINPAHLPGAGKLAGTFVGQLLLLAGSDTATIPVTVTVGNGAFAQLNPLNFVMPVGGANPLPQILTVPGLNNAVLHFYTVTTTATGGNWLNVPACSNSNYPCTTPFPVGVGVKNASSLPAGTYTGQVTIYEDTNPAWSVTAPVTLTVIPTSKAFFDNMPGQTSFSLVTGATTTPSQKISLGNGGTGTLSWKIGTNNANAGGWLKVTPTLGTNAGTYTVSVAVASLPGHGKTAGTFVGQTVLQAASGNVTIPVAVTVNSPVFVQPAPLGFSAKQGTNPASQTLPIDSSSNALNFFQITANGKGGNWLSISTCNNSNYPCSTPTNLTVNVNSSALAVGTYYADINVYQDTDPAESMTIPVVLTVTP